MAKVIDDHFMVCTDCLMVIANGDHSGLDYHYDEEEAVQREAEIDAGIKAAGDIACGDSESDLEFSTSDCDCCGSPLAGARHHCVILGPDDDDEDEDDELTLEVIYTSWVNGQRKQMVQQLREFAPVTGPQELVQYVREEADEDTALEIAHYLLTRATIDYSIDY